MAWRAQQQERTGAAESPLVPGASACAQRHAEALPLALDEQEQALPVLGLADGPIAVLAATAHQTCDWGHAVNRRFHIEYRV
jgi:hypothetical protein